MDFKIEFYTTNSGRIPVSDFLESLDKRMQARALRMITLLAHNGNELRPPDSKYLIDGIFELRIKSGHDISRILYFFYFDRKIILTNGFIKKTPKTPKKEIELAIRYKKDYIEQKGGDIHGRF